MSTQIPLTDEDRKRGLALVEEHYQIEKELFNTLRDSTKEERKTLYTSLYDELFQRVPHHHLLTRKLSPEIISWIVTQRMQLLGRYLSPNTIFMEIGPGDCSVSLEVAKRVKQVYAIDVSTEVTKRDDFPENFKLIVSDGCSIPVLDNSIDVAYSHQLMEHLHPDDAMEQLQNICRALNQGGIYICITPNRLSGPHDISKYFDEVSTGVHLKEYTVSELCELFFRAGFSKVKWVKSKEKTHIEIPLGLMTVPLIKSLEYCIAQLPFQTRRKIASTPMLFRGMTLIGEK
ncbi:MAG: class I SAM-dependent methyltransferase [Microcoleaceae cyanobacterium]